jgi:peptide/nickel transport system substrate-binding protein
MQAQARTGLTQPHKVLAIALVVAVAVVMVPSLSPVHAGSVHRSAASSKTTLVVAEPSDMQNLDPTLSSADIPTQETLTNLYSWLIDYKLVKKGGKPEGDPSSFVGGLASSFKTMNHGKTVRFFLRKGLKFANGDPLNANAVKFTYDRIYDQNGVTPYLLSTLSGIASKNQIVAVNKYTVDFKMSVANKLLFGNMAQFGHSILDPKVVRKHETKSDPYAHNWLATHATGTESGPYILKSWQPGSQWVLTANPHFYGPKPKIKTIIFKVIPDPSTRLALLKNGSVDIAYGIATQDIKQLKKDKNVRVQVFPSRFVVFLGMNSKQKPFNKIAVRQAIDYAVPYKTILKQVLLGYGKQLTSPVPAGTPTHVNLFKAKQNYAKAKALLRKAGYPNGFTTTLDVAQGSSEGQQAAVWVKEALANINVNVNIQTMPGATFTSDLQKHQLGFFFFNNWISINNDPFYHLYWLFHSACCDYTNYNNSTVNALINKWTLSNKTKQRDAASVKAQRIIVHDAPWAFLYQPDYIIAMRKNVKGYAFYSSDQFTRYRLLSK